MEIGYRASPSVDDAIEAGLRGLDIETTDEEPYTVAAGTVDDIQSIDQSTEGPWIAIEVGGIGGTAVDGIDGAVSVVDPRGPCYACLKQRVTASRPTAGEPAELDDVMARYAGAVAGRLLREVGVDGLETTVGTVWLLDGDELRLLPVPGCRCGSMGDRYDRPEQTDPNGDPLARAEQAVDPTIGPISQVGEQSSYPAPYYVAELADTSAFSDVQAARYAAGIDLEWDDAFMRALGEGLERYCAGVYRRDLTLSVPSENAIDLEDIPIAPEDAEPIERWWPAYNLHDDARTWLPLEAVVFPPPDGADIDAITTGLGLGETWTEAVLSGLLEVIERDACMLGWYSTYEPLELDVDSMPYTTLVRRMAGEGLASTALLMTQDLDVPVVTAVVHRRNADGRPAHKIPGTDADDWPAFAVGSAADIDPATAAERALAEAVQNWIELREMGPERADDEQEHVAEFARFPRQARGLIDAETTVEAGEIAPAGIEDAEDALAHCVEALEASDLTGYAARLTTRDVESLGFEAVRVVVPQAQPLVKQRGHFTDRLRSVPRELGFSPRLDRGHHPYP